MNGKAIATAVPARRLLSDALRHDLGLTAPPRGCEHAASAAPARSCSTAARSAACLTFAVRSTARRSPPSRAWHRPGRVLGPVQRAFVECHGLQCASARRAFLTTITAGLRDNPTPTHDEARDMVAGNLCRCTGYQNIVKAVERAAEIQQESS